MKYFIFYLLCFSFYFTFSQVPTVVPLEIQAQFNGQFDYVVIGNSHNEFDNWQNPPPPCQMLTQSSAQLNLNANQTIVSAYLYWSGIGDGTLNPAIQLNGIDIQGDVVNVVDPQQFGIGLYFGSFADVSDLVIQQGLGTYQFSGLDLNEPSLLSIYCSTAEYYSGWSLMVVYEDNSLPTQQINIYEGLASVYGNLSEPSSEASITVTNLNVVDTQNARIGYLAWNGSPNLFFNESISFKGTLLSNTPINPIDNPFNGTNSYTGASDLWNMDLDVFDISNFITLGDSQANLTFTSTFTRFIQNVVTVIRSELPDAQVELVNFNGVSDCDERDFTIETVVSNPESSDVLPSNTPISFFVLDTNGDEVFLDTFFTQNDIPINGSETQFLDMSIPTGIPNDTKLIVKVNTLADGTNPVNENNILNNFFEQQLNLLSSPLPIAVEDLSQCANLSEALFNLEEAFIDIPNPTETYSFYLNLLDAQNDINPINNPENYNPTALIETIFIRQSNANCFITTQFNLETLVPPQITPPTNFELCDLSSTQTGFASFDLNSKINEITGGNPDYEVNFFLTQAEAEDLTITTGLASPYINETAFSQILFVRITDTNNNCVSFTELELQVNLQPVIADALNIPVLVLCDDDDNGEEPFDLTLNNSTILNGLDPSEHQIQFYTSQIDAENEVNAIPNPTAFSSVGQTVFVRVTETTTACFALTSYDLEVNPIPDLQDVPSIVFCDTNNDGFASFDLTFAENSILPDITGFSFQYFESLNDAQNAINPISDPENFANTQSPIQSIFVLVNDADTGCQNIQSFDIEVLENPFINTPSILTECDSSVDQIGFAEFDLDSKIPEITGNNPDYEVIFFLTQAEAEDLAILDGIASPYTNVIPFSQNLFIRVTDVNNGCVSFTELELQVNLLPVIAIPENIPSLEVCDDEISGEGDFDLTDNSIAILNGLDPSEHQIQFYTSQSDAENDLNEINNPDSFSSAEQTIFVRVTETSTGCFSITSFNVVVNPIPSLQAVPTNAICNTDNDGFAEFFLPLAEDTILADTTGFSFKYFETLTDAENNTNAIDNPETYTNIQTPTQTIFVLATDDNTGCKNIQSFNIEVLENPVINNPTILTECDSSVDQAGFASFDLDSKISEITGDNPNYEVNFFLTQAEAEDLAILDGIASPYTNETEFSQIIFVRVTDLTNNCVSFTTLELEVNSDADFFDETLLTNLSVCDEDNTAFFDLTQIENVIFENENSDDFTVNYYTSLADAQNNANIIFEPDNFQNTELPQSIWTRVSNFDDSDNCFEIASFDLGINFLPVASQPENLVLCDVDNDDIETFDLSQQNDDILNGLSNTENSISYHKTLAVAENNLNPVELNYTNENNPQTIYVRLENNDETDCFSITSFEIEVLETPVIDIEDEVILCRDEPLIVSIEDSYDEYLWSNGVTSSTITITEPGNYEVTAFINHSELSCESTKSFEVLPSDQATITDITTVDWSQNNNSITILIEGSGEYEYSIDGINYQDSNVFNNLTDYEYLVTIRDKNGCGETLRRVYLLDYPQFFTPNGDGINDQWQIINSVQEIFTKIYIFDRYGKLVANINPTSSGWDGTFNGNALPSSDYWFRVEREDGRVFTGHFTLKR